MERTLVICKPDAVERGLVGDIVSRLERKGLTLEAGELRRIDRDAAHRLYEVHQGRQFFDKLVDFVTRSPAMVLVVAGGDDVCQVVRTLIGPTDPREAAPGTVRGDLGRDVTENLVHASDSPETAEREIGIFFPHL